MRGRLAVLVAAGVVVLAVGVLLVRRAASGAKAEPQPTKPKPVTVVAARESRFREQRTYIGSLRPWIEAHVGPQFVSAYVETVLVRPGAVVKRGETLATLDCRNASASSQAVAAEARAIDEQQRAVSDEAARMATLLDGGFIDPNSVQLRQAQSASQRALFGAQRARFASSILAVGDCILRAPFDGEVATRTIDPGAFVRPGTAIVSVVDRGTVRLTFDVPEDDFAVVAPETPVTVRLLATDRILSASVSRRSPSADPDTRTVHIEVDLADANREIPVNTTGEVHVEVGDAVPATAIPLDAASISGLKAAIFVVEDGIARKTTYRTLGERDATLYLDPALRPGVPVVLEGRAVLADGDRVTPRPAPSAPSDLP